MTPIMRVREPFCVKCGAPAQSRGMCPRHYQQWRSATPKAERSRPLGTARHGQSGSRAFHTWVGMRQRCRDANTPAYRNYGARGIRVCERWMKFESFLADMGHPPEGHELDRIDNDGNYEPSNCRWVPPRINSRNTRHNHMIEFGGERLCITDWAARVGISPQGLLWRIRRWGVDRAIGTVST